MPLRQAHAHNDYHHQRPLEDALAHGFCSVEADIFLVNGALLVGHDRDELRKDKTLSRLYLDPLRHRIASNGGRVYRNGPTFTLMIDIKSSGPSTYQTLHNTLKAYGDIVTHIDHGKTVERAVQVIVSGNRDNASIAASDPRFVGIDGRLSDLTTDMSSDLMPMISDNWRLHFGWRGEGPFPNDEASKLATIVDQAHAAGRRVRFWATPESPAVWSVLNSAGVDLINTDALADLASFLREAQDKTNE